MKFVNLLLLLLLLLIIYLFDRCNCNCNLIEGLYFNQDNPEETIQEIGILSKDCKLPNISPTRNYACSQSDNSCFDISKYQQEIGQMNSVLKNDKREINLIGYLGGGPWGVPIDPWRFMQTNCDTNPDRCVEILPKIQDIPYYNTIILCYANFTGTASNPKIVVTGAFNLNDTNHWNIGSAGYPPPSNNNIDVCFDCQDPNEGGICTQYCSKFNFCGNDQEHINGGINCSDARCYKCSECGDEGKVCTEYCSQYDFCGNSPDHKNGGLNCSGCKYIAPQNKYGKLDSDTKAFIGNIRAWKSVDEYSYKGPKRKVLMTFGGSADQRPQDIFKGDPTRSGYTYNLLRQRPELGNKSILMSFLDIWNLDGIDLDYEFSGNLSGNSDDNLDTGVKNNWRYIIQHLKKYKKVVYATPYGQPNRPLQQQYNYLLNKNYMGAGNTIDVMQHQMYNGGENFNSNSNWKTYLEIVMDDIKPYNSNITLESFGSVFTNYSEDRSGNCWDLILYIIQIIDQIKNSSGGEYVTNHGAFLIEYDNYYGYYFGKLIDNIRVDKPKPKPKPPPSPPAPTSCKKITESCWHPGGDPCCPNLVCKGPNPVVGTCLPG